jgi:hypothetical protein
MSAILSLLAAAAVVGTTTTVKAAVAAVLVVTVPMCLGKIAAVVHRQNQHFPLSSQLPTQSR